MKPETPTDSISVAVNDDIEEKLLSQRDLPQYSICRVPEWICNSDPDAYKPQVVSIGPYHRGAQGLEAMEKFKWRFLAHIKDKGNRNDKPHVLKDCMDELKRIEEEARECYAGDLTMNIDREHLITETTFHEGDNPLKKIEKGHQTVGNLKMMNPTVKTEMGDNITLRFDRGELLMKSDTFVEMLLLDGCFLIGLLLEDEYHLNDPVFNNQWAKTRVAIDVLLLENQLPLPVLEALYGILCHVMKNKKGPLLTKIRAFFQNRLGNKLTLRESQLPPFVHLLHFVHASIPSVPKKNCTTKHFSLHRRHTNCFIKFMSKCLTRSPSSTVTLSEDDYHRISTATELSGAGVEFERSKIDEGENFLEVEFDKGRMKMGQLLMDDRTNRIFRNFIAFEQCLPTDARSLVFSNYSRFVDSLVSTAKDVKILKECAIIDSLMGSNEEVAVLFNKLCDGIRCDLGETPHLKDANDKAIKYSKKRWTQWRAKIVGDYFSNPWATISLIVATMLFFVTMMQFVYTNLNFYRDEIHTKEYN